MYIYKRKNTHRYKQREFLAEMHELRNLFGETLLFTAVKHGLSIGKINLLIDRDRLLLSMANEMKETPFYAAVESLRRMAVAVGEQACRLHDCTPLFNSRLFNSRCGFIVARCNAARPAYTD